MVMVMVIRLGRKANSKGSVFIIASDESLPSSKAISDPPSDHDVSLMATVLGNARDVAERVTRIVPFGDPLPADCQQLA